MLIGIVKDPNVIFHSPNLPAWLSWNGNKLQGTPDIKAQDCVISVIATYTLEGDDYFFFFFLKKNTRNIYSS